MDNLSRKPGRPTGSGMDDGEILQRLADHLLAKPMKPMAAIKELLDRPEKKDIDRIQRKWKRNKDALMVDAVRRANPTERNSNLGYLALRDQAIFAQQAQEAFALFNTPEIRAAQKYMASAEYREMVKFMNDPHVRTAREVMASREVQETLIMQRRMFGFG